MALWHGTDFPSRQTASVSLDPDLDHWEILGPELELGNHKFSTVWMRRPGRPLVPLEIDPADQQFALRECRYFLAGLYRAAGADAFWVNPMGSASRADIKLEQLRSAVRAGFKIPRTLLSNDPARIRAFLRANPACIYKSFYPVSWYTPDYSAVLFSSICKEVDLPDDPLLKLTPGIFQTLVPKSYELRVTAMGNTLFTAKLESQGLSSAQIDWRAATEPFPLEPAELPGAVAEACRHVMKDLGIVYGCFDLIVTPEGDYVFLEVNEMGAFLWIEEQNPDFRLVDAFCQFLVEATPDFRWQRAATPVPLADVHARALQAMEIEAAAAHVPKESETLRDNFEA